jgi:hypothetical protein
MYVRTRIRRAPALCAVLGGLLQGFLGLDAAAQGLPATPPLPPPRPAMPADPRPNQAIQDTPAPAPKPQREEQQTPPRESPKSDMPWPPDDLGALRACAIEWRRMLETGAAGDMTWRAFAPDCLARQSKSRD